MAGTQLINTGKARSWKGAALSGGLLLCVPTTLSGQAGARPAGELPAGTPAGWAEAAASRQVDVLREQGTYSVRSFDRKIDARGDTTRDIIETRDGSVARLVKRNNEPISDAEDVAERARLQYAIDHPDDFQKHHRKDKATRNDAIQLLRCMPQAMIYTYAPGQPQPAGAKSKQVVLDFSPDPKFHPPTMISEVLTGLQGRIWIDEGTKTMTRIEGKVLHTVNFGFGVIARLYPGGTVEIEQVNAGGGHWVFSHLDEHLVVRALMVKTMPENAEITASGFEMLPAPLAYQDAIRLLLSKPIPLR